MQFLLCLIFAFVLPLGAYATLEPVLDNSEKASLLNPQSPEEIENLVVAASEKLKGRPYLAGNLGEGPNGIYDQDPLYRLDVFDCTTFVETVVTNAYCNGARSSTEEMSACLETVMQKIRYVDDTVTFESRGHIAETDWVASNIRRGFFRDVTEQFGGSKTRYSHVITDKRGWFENRTLADIQTKDSETTKEMKLALLHQAGKNISPVQVSVPYLGFDSLFLADSHEPNLELLKRLPNGAVFNVVRENWNPPGSGTALAISHQGFIVQKSDGTYLRHASTGKSILDVKLVDYMLPFIHSPTIRGLNILQVQPKP